MLRLSTLVTASPERKVAEVMDSEMPSVQVDMPADEVAHLFQDLDLLSAPVVDADRRLLGRITVDDVVDQIRESSDRAMMHMAGLDEEADMFAPVLTSSRRRAVWLGINLVTAFLAAWVIGLFQTTLERVVALAVLMPIVASMGGIAGSQTLTLVIRGMALGQVEGSNARLALLAKRSGSRRSTACCGRSWWPCWRWLGSATGRSAASSARPFSSTCFSPRWRAWWCRWCSSEWESTRHWRAG